MILPEQPEHYDAVRRLTEEAFSASEFGHNGEAGLIEFLRNEGVEVVSLVSISDDDVVGHILFSSATIRCGDMELRGMGLGPMAVAPSCQRQGIGSHLIVAGLRELSSQGSQFTVVAGHPEYYPKFGFRLARRFGIMHGFAGIPQEVLYVHADDFSVLNAFESRRVDYHSAFGLQRQA